MSYLGHELTGIKDYLAEASSLYRPRLGREDVDLVDAVGRYLASSIKAVLDVPPCDKPVLDGYAVRYQDVMYASPSTPVKLRLLRPGDSVSPGTAVPVEMKDCIPEGADTVVPLEWCREVNGSLLVYRAPKPGYAVARRGEDVRAGSELLSEGTRINEAHVALLASQGIAEATVWEELKAAVLCIGDELLEPGEEWRPGMVYNSTCRLVAARLRRIDVEVTTVKRLPDNPARVYQEYEELTATNHLVLSCGGTGPGKGDVAATSLRRLAEERGWRFWHGFRMRPGRAAAIAVSRDRVVAALSGLPLSAWSQLYMLIEPLIMTAYGAAWPLSPVVRLPTLKPIASTPGITELYYATLRGGSLDPIQRRGAGKASLLATADALIVVGEDEVSKKPGDVVEAHLIHAVR